MKFLSLEEKELNKYMSDLVDMGEKTNLTPAEWALVLYSTSQIMMENLGIKIHHMEICEESGVEH